MSRHYIDALYDLARAGMRRAFSRTPTSSHDNPLRRIGREMAAREARSLRLLRSPKPADGPHRNPARQEKKLLRRELRLRTGRAWRRFVKAAQRAESLRRVVS